MPEKFRVRLEETDFRDLVGGKVVTLRTRDGATVEVILADIGYDRMARMLIDSIGDKTI